MFQLFNFSKAFCNNCQAGEDVLVEDTTADDMIFLVKGRAVITRRGVEVRSRLLYVCMYVCIYVSSKSIYICREVLCRSYQFFFIFPCCIPTGMTVVQMQGWEDDCGLVLRCDRSFARPSAKGNGDLRD